MKAPVKCYYKVKKRLTKSLTSPASSKPVTFKAKVWLYEGPASWHFITLPKTLSRNIKMNFKLHARGWGSLPVRVACGGSEWNTSIFPDAKADAYLLPLKADIRKKAHLAVGKLGSFTLTVCT